MFNRNLKGGLVFLPGSFPGFFIGVLKSFETDILRLKRFDIEGKEENGMEPL